MSEQLRSLNDVAEAEVLSLPADMAARFLGISELLESFRPTRLGRHTVPVKTRRA
ncbi:MAG: hypothetical protein ACREQR_20070 [Candidatus Binataceae bacterium]